MKPLLKIPRPLLLQAMQDLERPHSFAGERLGFFSFRQSLHRDRPLLLCYDYHSVPDKQYIRDRSCGGRIDGAAIQTAMGRAYRDGCGQLWVHTHGPDGHPSPSGTDLAEGPKVVRSLANAQGKVMQGWAIISKEGTWGQVRALDGRLHDFQDIAVIGRPMIIPRRTITPPAEGIISRIWNLILGHRLPSEDRYDRQSFLGAHSQRIFERCKITIVGVGGGGSHINQQLAHIGFQNVLLCDADRIDRSNLNRLVGATYCDAVRKRFKTHIASRLFRRLQPHANIDDRPLTWEAKIDLLRESDIVFGCIDSFTGRRDLEAFCRTHMIPYIDIGMVVHRPEGHLPEIYGQTILSMPGEPCLRCMHLLTEETLAKEAQDYNAGSQPQVVWPNGILSSAAVGEAVEILTGWSGASVPASRIDLRGSKLTMTDSKLLSMVKKIACRHYPLSSSGDPLFSKL